MVNRLNRLYRQCIESCRSASEYMLTGQCILCCDSSQQSLDLCKACELSLQTIKHHCKTCALPLLNQSEMHCGECLQNPPPFTQTEASWVYGFPVAQLISAYKYQRKLSYGQTLGKLTTSRLADAYSHRCAPDVIAAIPLHWRRQLRRGFNQSEMLAQYYSSRLQIPIFNKIKRTKFTQPQQSLNAKQRKNNLHNAFSISNSELIKGKLVAVVDDVMTTGATAKEISQTLLAAGAREVHIWVLARTPQ